MVNPIGFRFCPNDEEIVDHYLRLKNLGGDTSYVDGVISTVNLCSFDPWDLPSQAMIKSKDQVWYFFSVKENKYSRGDRQSRKTNSGFWKKTGVTMNITRKRSNREKIGEKRVLVFHFSKNQGGSKSHWVMHEYLSTLSSPINQETVTYAVCKVEFKGEETEISSSAGSDIVDHSDSLIPLVNISQGLTAETEEEAQLDDALSLDEEWKTYLVDDEQMNILCMQDDRNDYRPQKPFTGVFSDDSDSDLISATTNSIQTSSTCDSFGSSNHRVDQITDLQESSNSTIKLVSLTQEVSKALGASNDTSEKKNHNDDAQGTEIGEHKLGQETVKNKRAGFFCRMIQKFFKKIHLSSSISRTRYQ